MKTEFDKLIESILGEDAAAPAGAMSTGPIVAASVNTPASPDATYVLARPLERRRRRKDRLKRAAGNIITPIMKRSTLEK